MLKKHRKAKRFLAAAVMTCLLTGIYMGPVYADTDGPVVNITGVYADGKLKLLGTNGNEYPSMITVGEILSAGLTPGQLVGAVEGVIAVEGSGPVTVDKTKDEAAGKITYTVGINTNGKIEAGDTGVVTGGTVFAEVNPGTGTFTYISSDSTAGGNLVALDGAVSDLSTALDGAVSGMNAALQKGITFNADGGTSAGEIGLGSALAVSGGANITTAGAPGVITVGLNPVLTGLESIETKDLTVSNKLTTKDFEATGDTVLNTLTVGGDTNIAGDTMIGGSTNIAQDLTVGGDTNIAGDTMIGGSTNITQDLTVGGDTNLKNVSATTVKVGDTVTISNDGIDMGGQKIINIKDGTKPGDAVSYGQLEEVAGNVGRLGDRIDRVDNRLDKVGAGAAALAALHPIDFDADDKLDFAAGWGHYHGKDAMALGAFYRPDERVMFSVGGAFGNGENLINAGVTFKLDKTRGSFRPITSKAEMTRKINKLEADNRELRQQLALLGLKLEELSGKNKES